MAVYLDTNQLVQREGISSLAIATTAALCREKGIDIVLPELVVNEVESSRRRVLEASFERLVAAHRDARRLAPVALLPELPNPGELAREYRRQLEAAFTVIPTPVGAAAEALNREAFRLRPARDGKGARDAAIWITLRDDHLRRDEAGYFVTNNSRDFAALGDNSSLHDELAAEIAGHEHALALYPSLGDLAKELAEPTEGFVDEAGLISLAPLKRAAIRLLHERSFLDRIEPPVELGASQEALLFAGTEAAMTLTGVQRLDFFQVEGRRIGLGQLAWDINFELGTLEKAGPGRTQRSLPVSCSVVGRVLIGEQEALADPVVEIVQVVAVKTVAL